METSVLNPKKSFETPDRQKFIWWLKNRRLTDSTINQYLFYYDKFGSYQGITQEYVDSFLRAYNSITPCYAFLKNYFLFLTKYGEKYQFPDFDLKEILNIEMPENRGKKERKLPVVISENQIWVMERAMTNERDKLMLLLSFYCGLRIEELINIKPFDFDWDVWDLTEVNGLKGLGKVQVIGKGGGSGKARNIPVPNFIMYRMEEYLKSRARKDDSPNEPIWKIGKRRWQYIIETNSFSSLGKKIHPHTLRHSCATWLFEKGWDIKKIAEFLGHDNIQTTEIYTHVSIKNLTDSYSQLFDEDISS